MASLIVGFKAVVSKKEYIPGILILGCDMEIHSGQEGEGDRIESDVRM